MTDVETASAGQAILIVEDNAVGRKLLETVLRPHGYRLLFARSGQEAIEVANQEHPDLILMDMKLPGISGCDIVQALKSQPETASIPVVALTAHALGSERQRAMAVGCEEYIIKPIDTRTFPHRLRQYLGRESQ